MWSSFNTFQAVRALIIPLITRLQRSSQSDAHLKYHQKAVTSGLLSLLFLQLRADGSGLAEIKIEMLLFDTKVFG